MRIIKHWDILVQNSIGSRRFAASSEPHEFLIFSNHMCKNRENKDLEVSNHTLADIRNNFVSRAMLSH